MRGGLIQINFPTNEGWAISDKSIKITEGPSDSDDLTDIYQTNSAGEVLDGEGGRER